MTSENEEVKTPKEEPAKLSQSDLAFERLSAIEPELEVLLPDEGEGIGGGHKTLAEKMEESPNLSDIQALDKGMFPDLGYKHLNVLMVSRVFPDNYNSLQSLLVKDLLMNNEDLSVAEAIVYVHTPESIAIDGEGRIDKLALGGAAKEEEELKKEEKKLGLGGIG